MMPRITSATAKSFIFTFPFRLKNPPTEPQGSQTLLARGHGLVDREREQGSWLEHDLIAVRLGHDRGRSPTTDNRTDDRSLVEPLTALPMRAPAAALPAIAPRLRARVEPAMIDSVSPWTEYLCPAMVIELSPRSSMARSPFLAALTDVTVPATGLPAGIPSRPVSAVPLHAIPSLAVSDDRAVPNVTSIEVPIGSLMVLRGLLVLFCAT
jgi:hypothetical protein